MMKKSAKRTGLSHKFFSVSSFKIALVVLCLLGGAMMVYGATLPPYQPGDPFSPVPAQWFYMDKGLWLITATLTLLAVLWLGQIRQWRDILKMKTPRHHTDLWPLILVFPLLVGASYSSYLFWLEGRLSLLPRGAVAVPDQLLGLMGSALVVASIPFYIVSLIALWSAKFPQSLWLWRKEKPLKSGLSVLLVFPVVIFCLKRIYDSFPKDVYTIEIATLPVWACAIYIFLCLRAAWLGDKK